MAATLLWQGFEHEWLREVLGFRLPHRISRIASYLSGEPGQAATMHMAMAPGVDGNFMRPEGHYAAVSSPGLSVAHGAAHLQCRGRTQEIKLLLARATRPIREPNRR